MQFKQWDWFTPTFFAKHIISNFFIPGHFSINSPFPQTHWRNDGINHTALNLDAESRPDRWGLWRGEVEWRSACHFREKRNLISESSQASDSNLLIKQSTTVKETMCYTHTQTYEDRSHLQPAVWQTKKRQVNEENAERGDEKIVDAKKLMEGTKGGEIVWH